jgi:hypothetical protein
MRARTEIQACGSQALRGRAITLVKAGQGRGRSAPRSAIQQRYRFHDVPPLDVVDSAIVPAT